MQKTWTKYLLYTLLTLFLLAGGLAAYLMANKQEIKKYAIEQINAHLNAKVSVHDIDLTLFKQFPRVSLDLHLVSISDAMHKGEDLLKAEHIYIGFNIYDIIRKEYNIKLIAVDSARINLFTNAAGQVNYMIWKTDSPAAANSNSFLFSLKEVVLNNVHFDYRDLQQKQYYDLGVQSVTLSGDFNSKGEHIACKGLVYARKIKTNQLQLLRNKLLALDIELDINNQSSTYTFKKGLVDVDLLKLDLKGSISNKPDALVYDLKIGARNLDIQGLMSMLPANVKLPDDIKTTGNIYFNGVVKGIQNASQSPGITLDFGVKNGSISKGNGPTISNLQLSGNFSNGVRPSAKNSKLQLSNLSFNLNKGQVAGSLEITDLSDPVLNTQLKGDLDIAALLPFLVNVPIKHAEGNTAFDITFNGKLAHVNAKNWLNNKAAGTVQLSLRNIQLTQQPDQPISQLDAVLILEHKNAIIQKLSAHKGRSDIQVHGVLNNIVPYLLLENESLEADISYQSTFIDLNNLLVNNDTDTAQSSFALPHNLSIHAQLKAEELVYNLFSGKQVTADVHWKGKIITIDNLSAQTMGGKLAINGQLENAPDGRFLISASGNLNQIDITSLFHACSDFGQQEITQKHLKGKLSGTFSLVSVWSNNFTCDLNKLYAQSQVQISNGELNNYEPLNALGKYIDVNELKNLRFADLSNKIEIKNKTINIPQFDVKNNALNITLSGTHTFDNFIDYRLKIKLNELLKNKRKNKPNEFNEEETSDRGVNLFMSMKGPIDNFKITYDKVGVKQKISQEIKQEQQQIKEILKKELGLDKKSDPDIKEKKDDSEELEFEPDN